MSQTGTDRLQSVEELWAEFKATARPSARDRLILHYSPLVKYVAGRVAAAMPNHVDYADLVSYGILGLIDAIEKFDPSRAIKFETYGVPRVRGAILDELRSIDWVPRSVRAKARAVDTAFAKLEGKLGRSPTDQELADELGDDDRRARRHPAPDVAGGAVAARRRAVPPGWQRRPDARRHAPGPGRRARGDDRARGDPAPARQGHPAAWATGSARCSPSTTTKA